MDTVELPLKIYGEVQHVTLSLKWDNVITEQMLTAFLLCLPSRVFTPAHPGFSCKSRLLISWVYRTTIHHYIRATRLILAEIFLTTIFKQNNQDTV